MNRNRLAKAWKTIEASIQRTAGDDVPKLAAATAFYTVFSLAPLVVLAISVASLILGAGRARTELVEQARMHLGAYGERIVETILRNAEAGSTVMTAASLAASILGATVVFASVQDALNRIWRVSPKGSGLAGYARGFVRKRLISLMLVLCLGLILMMSVAASSAISVASAFLPEAWWGGALIRLADAALSIGVLILLFGSAYRILPDVDVGWRQVWPGAVSAAVLFTIGKLMIAWYLGSASVTSVYGAGGTFAALLVWIYYSAHIFYFCAEVNCAFKPSPEY